MRTKRHRVSTWTVKRFLHMATMAGMMLVSPQGMTEEPREDCIGFNPDRIEAKQVQARWKLVEGSHWLLDFGGKKTEADQAYAIIKKYSFDSICFVGRPDPSMTYFTNKKPVTTVFIVRHGEKKDNAADSPLSRAGECRAETLARMLKPSGISAVFATSYSRTRETVNNYADSASPRITIQTYTSPENLAQSIRSGYAGKSLLVASHSGTIEQIIQRLGAGSVLPVNDEFNNLFIVTIPPSGAPRVTRTKYETWPAVISQMNCRD